MQGEDDVRRSVLLDLFIAYAQAFCHLLHQCRATTIFKTLLMRSPCPADILVDISAALGGPADSFLIAVAASVVKAVMRDQGSSKVDYGWFYSSKCMIQASKCPEKVRRKRKRDQGEYLGTVRASCVQSGLSNKSKKVLGQTHAKESRNEGRGEADARCKINLASPDRFDGCLLSS